MLSCWMLRHLLNKMTSERVSFYWISKGRKIGLASKTVQQKLAFPVRSHQRWLQMCTMRDFVWAVLYGLINGAGFYTCGHISSGIMSRGNTPSHRHSFKPNPTLYARGPPVWRAVHRERHLHHAVAAQPLPHRPLVAGRRVAQGSSRVRREHRSGTNAIKLSRP